MWCVWKLIKSVWGFTVHVTYTPSVPNYKSFQEPWRVKKFQVWPNLNNKIIIFTISIKYHRFFISHIFIVYLFDVINLCVSLYNFGQTLRWFDSPRFLEWLIIWNTEGVYIIFTILISAHKLILLIYGDNNYKSFQESWIVKPSQSFTKIIQRNTKIYDIK